MGTSNLYRRSFAVTKPPAFEVTHNDAARRIQARDGQIFNQDARVATADKAPGPDEIVKAATEDKPLVWEIVCRGKYSF